MVKVEQALVNNSVGRMRNFFYKILFRTFTSKTFFSSRESTQFDIPMLLPGKLDESIRRRKNRRKFTLKSENWK